VRHFLLFPLPGPAARDAHPPLPAMRGPDLTGRAERSVSRPGPTDGPPQGAQTAPGRPPATPAEGPGTADDPLLTIEEVTAELRVSRAAFYRRRRRGAGPAVVRLRSAACGSGAARSRRGCAAWKKRTRTTDRSKEQMDSYDVRFWDIRKLGNGGTAVPGPVGRRRARALQVLQGPPPRRRVPRRAQGRGLRPAALQPPYRPARRRDHRGGDGHLV
jgi:hypothetical protein